MSKLSKKHKIFIGMIILEVILLTVLYLFFQNPCGSPCSTQGLLDPFGTFENESGACIQVCVQTQNFWFYPLADLTILTIIAYLIFLSIKMKGGNDKKE